jgi:hypothetical protein
VKFVFPLKLITLFFLKTSFATPWMREGLPR